MKFFLFAKLLFLSLFSYSQTDSFYLLKPDRVFDGEQLHTNWTVLVKGNIVEAAGAINFKSIFAKAELSGLKHFYIEQENYSKSSLESVKAGINNLKAII